MRLWYHTVSVCVAVASLPVPLAIKGSAQNRQDVRLASIRLPQFPQFSIAASIRHGIEVISLWHCWDGSPGFFDSGIQLIYFFGLLFLIFLLTISHRFSMGFRSGEFAGQSSTPTPWPFNQLLVLLAVWAGAKSCWKMKSPSLKSWSVEESIKCSKISW